MIQSPTFLNDLATSGSKSFVFRVSPASVRKHEVPQTSFSSSRCGSSCLSLKEFIRIGSFFQIGAQKGLLILELAEAIPSRLSVTRVEQSRVGFLFCCWEWEKQYFEIKLHICLQENGKLNL